LARFTGAQGGSVSLVVWFVSFSASTAIAFGAYRARALSLSGALAAMVVGGLITASGGWRAGALLVGFFVSASLLSKVTERYRPEQGRNVARGSRRDAWQVIANGGIATLCAAIYGLTDEPIFLVAFAASLAAAAADTWATEIGAYSRRRPRLITNFAPVPRGTSGAVSPLGTAATVAGALAMAVLAALLLGGEAGGQVRMMIAVALGGVAGSVIDSLLGATVQVQFTCPACRERTEARIHRCGTPTVQTRGFTIVTNDVVNISAIIAGTLVGALLWLV
jgi:uncharacterized protein (TIGR00297 family)